MRKKLGLALGAGGSRGVAHIGFLKALDEEGIKPDFIAGVSMGSIVGACYSAGYTPDFMIDEILKLKMSDIFDLSFNPVKEGALLKAQKMRKKLSSYFVEKRTFNDLNIPFRCVAVNLVDGGLVVFSGEDDVGESIATSSTVPGVFRPVIKDGKVLVDGGIKCRVPIDTVKNMGAEVVVAVDVLGNLTSGKERYHYIGLMLRTFDVMDEEIAKLKRKKQKPNLYLAPDLGDMSQFKFKDLEFAFEQGYKLGKKNIKKIKKLIEKE
ncbi:MAG: hypothetical protein E7373_07380 [Clostridiales bacterium]|nr:hypothetical protein [Clostridiales bacterium]